MYVFIAEKTYDESDCNECLMLALYQNPKDALDRVISEAKLFDGYKPDWYVSDDKMSAYFEFCGCSYFIRCVEVQ